MMNYFFYSLVVIAISLFLFFIIWRFVSQKRNIPCPSWLGWMIERDNPFTRLNQSAEIIKSLRLQSGMYVLDAGCGPGRITIPVAKQVTAAGNVTAIDVQKEMLDLTKEKAQQAGLDNIDFVHAALGDGMLEHNIYDRALLVTVLGEIPQQKRALEEVFNALKPGGILSITETIFDPHYQRIKNVRALAKKVGFTQKRIVSDFFSYNLMLEKPLS
ncbi:class I SAM-dependent methyltransferase [Candidatus Babeliales bacterium]|nr:class I SAM-dependent methyltransferase [Candidatus Babeliales bacterium]